MGLDIVEFVMDVEEAFGVNVPDRIAPSLTTPRHLIDYLHRQLPPSVEARCLGQRAFYAIRRVVSQRHGVPRDRLRPGTDLMSILPPENAQTAWSS